MVVVAADRVGQRANSGAQGERCRRAVDQAECVVLHDAANDVRADRSGRRPAVRSRLIKEAHGRDGAAAPTAVAPAAVERTELRVEPLVRRSAVSEIRADGVLRGFVDAEAARDRELGRHNLDVGDLEAQSCRYSASSSVSARTLRAT